MAEVTIQHAGPAPAAATPARPNQVVDSRGRCLVLRELNLLQEQDLIIAMGAEAAQNPLALGRAMAASRVASIDGVDVAVPSAPSTYRAMLQRVGHEGLAAVLAAEAPAQPDEDGGMALAKNSAGTPEPAP